jgi:hypothetical protein
MDCFEQERSNKDFDQEELSRIIYNGQENLDTHRKIIDIFATDPILKVDNTFYDLPREQQMGVNIQRTARMNNLHKENPDFPKVSNMNVGTLADYSGSVSSVALHYGMFETAIKFLGSDEQTKEYLQKVSTLEITG